MAIRGWRGWYHCTVGTYGTWLPGDARGWRERDHHEHVEGDYERPPQASAFAQGRHDYSKKIMRLEPYLIQLEDRQTVGELILGSLRVQHIPILSLAVCEKNFHAMIQCQDGAVKRILGEVKKHVTFRFAPVVDEESKRRRPMWEGEGGVKPIADRSHALNVFQYILDHVEEGGWVWSFRDAVDGDGTLARAVGDGGL